MKYVTKEIVRKVPLDWNNKAGAKIDIFAREVYLPKNKNKDVFVFQQGGPGFPSPRDFEAFQWITEVLKKYRILFVDQRGTGKSTKIGPELAKRLSVDKQVQYFSCHRADSIVKDTEYLRKSLQINQWFLLGQSYGGFVIWSYLSMFPDSIKGAITTGGCPPLTAPSVDAIYKKLVANINRRNIEFYKAYPKDAQTMRRIVEILRKRPYKLPDGGKMTAERFLNIGIALGATNNLKIIHNFIEDPFLDSTKRELSYNFIESVRRKDSYETNPIYAVLHESIYSDSNSSRWAADRALKSNVKFSLDNNKPRMTGETIRRKMFDEYAMLQPFKECAKIIAAKKWGPLYDLDVLSENRVPIEAMVYKTDYYVDYDFSMEAIKATRGARANVHKTWQHDSLRINGKKLIERVLPKLIKRV